MAVLWSLLFIGLIACLELASGQPKTLYFSFVTAHSDQYTALGAIPAVDLALQRINSDSTILPGYLLNYTTDVGNSMCERTLSLDVFFSRLFNSSQPQYVAMLCCGCSVAAIPVAEISHHWNVPQMAYAAASLTLNNRRKFRSFFRTMPVYTNMGVSVAELAETFSWRQIAVVTESNGLFVPVLDSLQEVATIRNLRLHSLVLESTVPFPFSDLFNWDEDYRIIFINAYPGPSQNVVCEAYRRGLYGPRYVWITINWGEGWWVPRADSTVPCTEDQLVTVLYRGLTIIPSGFFIREDRTAETLSGLTPAEFERLYADQAAAEGYNPYSRFGLSYDAMWAIAVGLDNALTRIQNNDTSGCEDVPGSLVPLEDFEYDNSKMGCVLRESYHETNFSGVTGQIMFNSNGSRINNIVTIRQYRESEGTLMMVTVGEVRVAEQINSTTFEFGVGETLEDLWLDGPPYDGSAQNVVHPVALPIVIIYNTLASVGLLCAAGCTMFNIIFRKKKIVKLSSPNLNYLIIVGAVLLYTCVYLYTYTVGSLDETLIQSVVCNLRLWLSAIGYTLCFAVILSKTWRIYYIFSNPTKRKKTFHDWMLLAIVAVVVAVDVVIFLIGTAVPQTRIIATQTSDVEHPSFINDQQIIQRNFVFSCDDNVTVWLSVSYAYKGLLQLVAMFMAFHTRKIKIRALNDSKEIAAIVYINSIILVLLIVVEFPLRQYHYVYASLYGLALLVGGSLFLGLTFIPKMISLYRDPDGDNLFSKTLPPGNGLTDPRQSTVFDDRVEMSSKEDTGTRALRSRITLLETKIAQMEGNGVTVTEPAPEKNIAV